MKLRVITISALMFAGLSGLASADVYRWVDEHGEAHYTDQWVPGSQLIKSSRSHPGSPTANAEAARSTPQNKVAPLAAQPSKDAADPAAAQAMKQDVAKVRAQQCKEAQDRYQQAIEARRLYKSTKDGERDYMSDEEADAYRVKARQEVQEVCGKPPAAPPAQ
jgi:hypothetical protein